MFYLLYFLIYLSVLLYLEHGLWHSVLSPLVADISITNTDA